MTDKPRVLNKRIDTIPKGAVYVGRPSKWGNPFKIGSFHNGKKITFNEDAVRLHKEWLLYSSEGQILVGEISELKGKDLVCWCAPLPCHADVLLEMANE